jgi:hypothetical protein
MKSFKAREREELWLNSVWLVIYRSPNAARATEKVGNCVKRQCVRGMAKNKKYTLPLEGTRNMMWLVYNPRRAARREQKQATLLYLACSHVLYANPFTATTKAMNQKRARREAAFNPAAQLTALVCML